MEGSIPACGAWRSGPVWLPSLTLVLWPVKWDGDHVLPHLLIPDYLFSARHAPGMSWALGFSSEQRQRSLPQWR